MSFAIWYKVDVAAPGGAGLSVTVSNDVLAHALALDAEITVTMTEGAATDTFEVTLINLPTETADQIRAVHATTAVTVSVHLGYFDDAATRNGDGGLVLAGRVTRISSRVGEDGYARTVLYGQETAGYLLRNTPAAGQATDIDAVGFARKLVERAGGRLAPGSTLPGGLTGFTLRAGSTLDALRALTTRAGLPLVVRDGDVYLGNAVGAATDTAPVDFDPDTNIVALHSVNGEDTAGKLSPPVHATVCMTVLGHPRLRVGQVAKVTGLSGVPSGTLRLSKVVHRFATDSGYTARLELIAAEAGTRAQVTTGVQVVADRLRDMVDRAQDDRPAIDVGEVTQYTVDGHVASLHYSQDPDPAVTAPSVASPADATLSLLDKPIASAFAFDQTGLVVPVYPGMRALLAHNRGLVNDAVLAGFIWPDEAADRRPRSQRGDYWLALPTRLGPDGRPTGPGANDLTDGTGHRVIQTAGLRIQVGVGVLPDVGTRPTPPADGSITIEHESGTTIKVDTGGGVTISTNHKPITLTNGGVSVTLDGAKVAVS
ncbi:hypothetical protein [Actinophytocola sp.]|uniref:hypothetical protein n=1 Tax=Actinophytocola sp. TaxID=1872138 RepID=UPI00389A987F